MWATTLGFDGIATPNCGSATPDVIPAGYNGFSWHASFGVECNSDYMGAGGSGNSYGSPSAPNAVYNQFGDLLLTITRGSLFTFDGAKFSGWTVNDLVDIAGGVTAKSVTVTGFNGATIVGSNALTLAGADGSGALKYLAMSGIAGNIDKLEISTPGNFWLMDDFQFTDQGNGPPPSVPEPASLALFGLGMAALAAAQRRRHVA